MRRRMRNPRDLKSRLYAAPMINLNEYLDIFPWSKASDKNCETE